jgi:hypothetical protein
MDNYKVISVLPVWVADNGLPAVQEPMKTQHFGESNPERKAKCLLLQTIPVEHRGNPEIRFPKEIKCYVISYSK